MDLETYRTKIHTFEELSRYFSAVGGDVSQDGASGVSERPLSLDLKRLALPGKEAFVKGGLKTLERFWKELDDGDLCCATPCSVEAILATLLRTGDNEHDIPISPDGDTSGDQAPHSSDMRS
ncbi:hypothetical protein M231_06410 [Tremella mesenterica]|uniref:Uncharacterized protein n=1 Tax=Tremella mesenterica TaxID=5217 RepID=A0A4Q1BF75_TREME|nr:hypothetical protein M231_06410 [Tremella mesenterica]